MAKVTKPAQRLYRHRDDTAYVEASRDALLRHLIKVGHSPAWIEVLMGFAPGIVLPNGEVDLHELGLCRQAVIALHGKAAPETPYDDELDQYLTPDQRRALGEEKPVIMMAFVERQLNLGIKPQNTDLQNRVRDAIAFGMAQSLQYIGRYMAEPALAISKTVDGAVRDAAGLLCGSWRPEGARFGPRDDFGQLMELKRTGDLSGCRALFTDPDTAEQIIKDDVTRARKTTDGGNLECQFWYTVAAGLLSCNLHDGVQVSGQREMSRALKALRTIALPDRWQFFGVSRPAVSKADLVALAYFNMPDVHRLFPAHHFHFPEFEAAAALGDIARNRVARVDSKAAARLAIVLRLPMPPATAVSREQAPPIFSHEQFLRYAMARVGSDDWWMQVLNTPPDNFGVRYIWRGMDAPSLDANSNYWTWEDVASIEPLARLRRGIDRGYIVQFAKHPDARIWKCQPNENVAVLDLDRLARFCGQDPGAWTEVLLAILVDRLRTDYDDRYAQTVTPLRPGYFLALTRIASATNTVMKTLFPDRSVRSELDLQYYSRFLTKREFESMRAYGEITGDGILVMLGKNVTAQIIEAARRIETQNEKLVSDIAVAVQPRAPRKRPNKKRLRR